MSNCAHSARDDELAKELDGIIEPYRGQPGGLIQVLTKAQRLIGYLPKWVQVDISEGLGVSLQEVYGVVTFYGYFSTMPRGRHKLSVCAGTACYVKGAKNLISGIRNHLGIKPGQTDWESRFTLEIVRCVGACSLAPAMIVDDKDVHGRLDPAQLPGILEQYQ
jgi:NADH-quinone oxidoreductase subunit E/NADP-reducing hydrogenase subunit HndA